MEKQHKNQYMEMFREKQLKIAKAQVKYEANINKNNEYAKYAKQFMGGNVSVPLRPMRTKCM
tara:strand:+ start:4274 stop:4459 length:186 start_codon:yes stop_codon:yes gene_type:complete